MKWPPKGLDPMLCRAIDSEGRQCLHERERSRKSLRTFCRGHRYRLARYGDLMVDIPLRAGRNELGPVSRT